MKTFFVKAEYNEDFLDMFKDFKYKGKVGLVSTIQFLKYLNDINRIVKDSLIGGQVLGCNVESAIKIKDKVDYFLYIGDGEFHPIEIARKTKKMVIICNPYTKKMYELKDIQKYENRIKGKIKKFLMAKRIGILVSTKPGQENLEKAFEFSKKIDKESFIFIGNEIRKEDLENFPDIGYWVNTACPRIDDEGIISIEELNEIIK